MAGVDPILVDAFEVLLEDDVAPDQLECAPPRKWKSEELISSCQILLGDIAIPPEGVKDSEDGGPCSTWEFGRTIEELFNRIEQEFPMKDELYSSADSFSSLVNLEVVAFETDTDLADDSFKYYSCSSVSDSCDLASKQESYRMADVLWDAIARKDPVGLNEDSKDGQSLPTPEESYSDAVYDGIRVQNAGRDPAAQEVLQDITTPPRSSVVPLLAGNDLSEHSRTLSLEGTTLRVGGGGSPSSLPKGHAGFIPSLALLCIRRPGVSSEVTRSPDLSESFGENRLSSSVTSFESCAFFPLDILRASFLPPRRSSYPLSCPAEAPSSAYLLNALSSAEIWIHLNPDSGCRIPLDLEEDTREQASLGSSPAADDDEALRGCPEDVLLVALLEMALYLRNATPRRDECQFPLGTPRDTCLSRSYDSVKVKRVLPEPSQGADLGRIFLHFGSNLVWILPVYGPEEDSRSFDVVRRWCLRLPHIHWRRCLDDAPPHPRAPVIHPRGMDSMAPHSQGHSAPREVPLKLYGFRIAKSATENIRVRQLLPLFSRQEKDSSSSTEDLSCRSGVVLRSKSSSTGFPKRAADRTKRNSAVPDVTMYRRDSDASCQPGAVRLCGIALESPLFSKGYNIFRSLPQRSSFTQNFPSFSCSPQPSDPFDPSSLYVSRDECLSPPCARQSSIQEEDLHEGNTLRSPLEDSCGAVVDAAFVTRDSSSCVSASPVGSSACDGTELVAGCNSVADRTRIPLPGDSDAASLGLENPGGHESAISRDDEETLSSSGGICCDSSSPLRVKEESDLHEEWPCPAQTLHLDYEGLGCAPLLDSDSTETSPDVSAGYGFEREQRTDLPAKVGLNLSRPYENAVAREAGGVDASPLGPFDDGSSIKGEHPPDSGATDVPFIDSPEGGVDVVLTASPQPELFSEMDGIEDASASGVLLFTPSHSSLFADHVEESMSCGVGEGSASVTPDHSSVSIRSDSSPFRKDENILAPPAGSADGYPVSRSGSLLAAEGTSGSRPTCSRKRSWHTHFPLDVICQGRLQQTKRKVEVAVETVSQTPTIAGLYQRKSSLGVLVSASPMEADRGSRSRSASRLPERGSSTGSGAFAQNRGEAATLADDPKGFAATSVLDDEERQEMRRPRKDRSQESISDGLGIGRLQGFRTETTSREDLRGGSESGDFGSDLSGGCSLETGFFGGRRNGSLSEGLKDETLLKEPLEGSLDETLVGDPVQECRTETHPSEDHLKESASDGNFLEDHTGDSCHGESKELLSGFGEDLLCEDPIQADSAVGFILPIASSSREGRNDIIRVEVPTETAANWDDPCRSSRSKDTSTMMMSEGHAAGFLWKDAGISNPPDDSLEVYSYVAKDSSNIIPHEDFSYVRASSNDVPPTGCPGTLVCTGSDRMAKLDLPAWTKEVERDAPESFEFRTSENKSFVDISLPFGASRGPAKTAKGVFLEIDSEGKSSSDSSATSSVVAEEEGRRLDSRLRSAIQPSENGTESVVRAVESSMDAESFSVTNAFKGSEPLSSIELFSIAKSLSTSEPFTGTESLSVTELYDGDKLLSTTDIFNRTESLCTTKPFNGVESLSVTEPFSGAESVNVTEPFKGSESISVTEPVNCAESVSVTEPFNGVGSICVTEPFNGAESVSVIEPFNSGELIGVSELCKGTTDSVTHAAESLGNDSESVSDGTEPFKGASENTRFSPFEGVSLDPPKESPNDTSDEASASRATDPGLLASESSTGSGGSLVSPQSPVMHRELLPLEEDYEQRARLQALEVEVDSESERTGYESGCEDEIGSTVGAEMLRLEEKLRKFELELGSDLTPACPGLRSSILPETYPPVDLRKSKHLSLMKKLEIEQYRDSGSASEESPAPSADASAECLFVRRRLRLKAGDRRCFSCPLGRSRPLTTPRCPSKELSESGEYLNNLDVLSQEGDPMTQGEVLNVESEDDFSALLYEKDQKELSQELEENPFLLGYMWLQEDGMTAVDFEGLESLRHFGENSLFIMFEDDLGDREYDDLPEDDQDLKFCSSYHPEAIQHQSDCFSYGGELTDILKSRSTSKNGKGFLAAFKDRFAKAARHLSGRTHKSSDVPPEELGVPHLTPGYTDEALTPSLPDDDFPSVVISALPELEAGAYNVPRASLDTPYTAPAICVLPLPDTDEQLSVYDNTLDEVVTSSSSPSSNLCPPEPPVRQSSLGTGDRIAWLNRALLCHVLPEVPRRSVSHSKTLPPAGTSLEERFSHRTPRSPSWDDRARGRDESYSCTDDLPIRLSSWGGHSTQEGQDHALAHLSPCARCDNNPDIPSLEGKRPPLPKGDLYSPEARFCLVGYSPPEAAAPVCPVSPRAAVLPPCRDQRCSQCEPDKDSVIEGCFPGPAAPLREPFHKPTSIRQLKRRQQAKLQLDREEEEEEEAAVGGCVSCMGVPLLRKRHQHEVTTVRERFPSPHPRALAQRRSWPPRK